MQALDQDPSPVGQRDKTLFTVMYVCGLRVSEAVALRVEDIDFSESALRVIGKGDKERRVYLKPAVLDLLRRYIDGHQRTGYLFPGQQGGPLSVVHVRHRLKVYVAKARLKKRVSPHTLRHSMAVHYLQAGAPVNFVQGFLGRTDLATTGKYLQLTDSMTKEIALHMPTALDRLAQRGQGKVVKERRAEYGAETADWSEWVANVLEWVAS